MGFPITVNSRTWNLSDFQNGNHHENLGQFLYDCLQDFPKRFVGTSSTTLSVGTGSKTLTTQTGKAWKVGQRIACMLRTAATGESNYNAAWMNGVITAYNSGTGSLTFTSEAFFGTGSFSLWNIQPGPSAVPQSTPLGTGFGGTGQTTLAGAQANFGLTPRASFMKSIEEDFVGYFPTVTTANPHQLPGLNLQTTGNGRILNGGNAIAKLIQGDATEGVTNPDHPGIIVLEASALNDAAEINFVNAPILLLGDDGFLLFGFYLPHDETNDQATQLDLGFKFYEQYNTVPSGGGETYPGFAAHYPGFGGALTVDVDVSVSGSESEQGGQQPIYPRKWHYLYLTSNGSGFYGELYYETDEGYLSISNDWSLSLPSQDVGNTYWPFIKFCKRTGTQPRTCLVDFVWLKRGASRT